MRADVLFTNAGVYTMDPRRPRARNVAVSGGRILACGDDDLAELRGPGTRVIDASGRAIVPGFVDAHIHFGGFGLARRQVNLDTATTLDEGLRLVHSAAEVLPADGWVRGRGWDRNRWGRLPTAADLDGVVGERPAALSSHDGHALWLSTAALQAVQISDSTPDPAGGVIERDEHGGPTGILFENAQDLVRGKIPEASADEIEQAMRSALPVAAAAGLTGIHNLEDARSRCAFRKLEQRGELPLRVYHGVARGELKTARADGLRTGIGSDWLRTGPVKLFSDGALGSRTAYMLQPYEGRADGYRGVATIEPKELSQAMRDAADAELDIAVHAIGDAAVRMVLDVFEQTRAQHPSLQNRMLRIEHAQIVDPQDVHRFQGLNVLASMQPIHAVADWRTADAHWGARAGHGYAWADLLRSGALLAFGTDAPVERIEPLLSLHAATTRLDPGGEPTGGWYPRQCLTLEQATYAYTAGSAAAERASARRGTISIGKDADLVVLAPDPFPLQPAALLETRVELTMVGGRVTFEAR